MASNNIRRQQQRPTPESGLEVVSSEYSGGLGPQVDSKNATEIYLYSLSPDSYNEPDTYQNEPRNQNEPNNQNEKGIPQASAGTEASHRAPSPKRKRSLIIIAVLLVIVAIAAVVGFVMGSRAANAKNKGNSKASDEDSTTGSDAAMTGTPTSVYPGLAPTAVSWGYPHLEVFALTQNRTDSVYRVRRDSNATSESDFLPGGKDMEPVGRKGTDTRYTPSIAVGHFSPGSSGTKSRNQTILHMKDDSYTAWRQYHDDRQVWKTEKGETKWNYFSGLDFFSPPTVVSYAQPRRMISTFAVGRLKNGHPGIYHYHFEQSDWHAAKLVHSDEPIVKYWAPAVVAWSGDESRYDVFAVSNTNNHLIHWYKSLENDTWSEHEDLGGFATTAPTAVSREPGRLDVFVRGGDGGLWHRALNGSAADPGDRGRWSDWQRLGGKTPIRGQPHAVSAGSTRADVFAWGTDGALLRKSWDDTAQSWRPADDFEVMAKDGLAGPPSAATDGTGNVYVFAYNTQNQIIWQTIEPKGQTEGELRVLANVPYSINSPA